MLFRQSALARTLIAQRNGSFAARSLAARHSQTTSLSTDANKDRPVSPHIFIYAWPIAAISSVMTRITGSLLTVGVYGIGVGALVGADMPATMAAVGASGIGPLVKLGVAFPLVYHAAAAGRHFYWEKFPAGLNPESQKQSSIALIGASTVISLGLMFV